MGEGEIDEDADVMERREGGMGVRMGTGEGGMEENVEGEIPGEEKHRPRMQARQAAVDREGRRTQFIRKRDEYMRQMEREVNIPRLNKEQMQKNKMGLEDLFKHEINPLMTEFQPDPGDWDGWCAFEGVYEESMHKIVIYILQALNRHTKKLYDIQQVNARLQAARE
jgi:hypothetical protein